jgi:RNA polymerase-binding transcription factor DksA
MPRATSPAAKAPASKKAAAPGSKPPVKRTAAKAAAPAKKTAKRVAPARSSAAKGSAKGRSNSVSKPATVKSVARKPTPAKSASRNSAPAKAAAKKSAPAKAAPARKAATVAKVTAPAHKAAAPAKKAAPPVRKSAGPVVLDKFHEGQRAMLLDERATYTRHAESLQAEADLLALDREPGDVQFDEESGEGDTLAVERERDLALSAQARAAIEEIDKALEKIAAGRYGVCDQCGDPIPRERLKAIPYAALCVKCKSGGLGRR